MILIVWRQSLEKWVFQQVYADGSTGDPASLDLMTQYFARHKDAVKYLERAAE